MKQLLNSTIDIAFTADLADKNVVNYLGVFMTVWGVLTVLFLATGAFFIFKNENWWMENNDFEPKIFQK